MQELRRPRGRHMIIQGHASSASSGEPITNQSQNLTLALLQTILMFLHSTCWTNKLEFFIRWTGTTSEKPVSRKHLVKCSVLASMSRWDVVTGIKGRRRAQIDTHATPACESLLCHRRASLKGWCCTREVKAVVNKEERSDPRADMTPNGASVIWQEGVGRGL